MVDSLSPRDLSQNGTYAEALTWPRSIEMIAALKAARVLVQEVHDAIDERPEMANDELNFSADAAALLRQIDEALRDLDVEED